jgi:hypothetical protein
VLYRFPMKDDKPVLSMRLPRADAVALRAFASRSGIPLNHVLRKMVTDWLTVNLPVDGNPRHATPRDESGPVIPAKAPRRADTGKSEPAKVLQAIDADRVAARGKPGLTD